MVIASRSFLPVFARGPVLKATQGEAALELLVSNRKLTHDGILRWPRAKHSSKARKK